MLCRIFDFLLNKIKYNIVEESPEEKGMRSNGQPKKHMKLPRALDRSIVGPLI